MKNALTPEGMQTMTEAILVGVNAVNKMKDLKTAELLAILTNSIVADTEFFGYQELLERIGAGRLTDAQVVAASRAGYQQAFPLLMEPWAEGKLFGCQGLDFVSCMMLTEEEVRQDFQTWTRVGTASSVLNLGGEFDHIRQFADTRIVIPFKHRRAFFDGPNLKPASSLPTSHRRAWLKFRSEFIAANQRWGWA